MPPFQLRRMEMEQRVLVIKIGRGKIISKPWNFEAMCLCDDNRGSQLGTMTLGAVYYLFEGTGATEEFLGKIGKKVIFDLCRKVQVWYYKDLLEAVDKNVPKKTENKDTRLRTIYKKAFEAFGILPKDLALCSPKDVFYILKEEEKPIDIPREFQKLYGM